MSEAYDDIPLTSLVADLSAIGVRAGDTLMVHSSLRAVGDVIGGANAILQALLNALTLDGTLMMMVGWEDDPYRIETWPTDIQQLYHEHLPAYDPATSRAAREYGYLCECFRTWPGTRRSTHPEGSFCAWGARADWIVADHPLQYGYGIGSPLEKLCLAGGKVLMLGAPLDTLTLLHYSEHLADVPNKRIERHFIPILVNGVRTWVHFEEYDTSEGIVDEAYTFEEIALEYLKSGRGMTGTVGEATSYLFDATDLAQFGIQWLEWRFGEAR